MKYYRSKMYDSKSTIDRKGKWKYATVRFLLYMQSGILLFVDCDRPGCLCLISEQTLKNVTWQSIQLKKSTGKIKNTHYKPQDSSKRGRGRNKV